MFVSAALTLLCTAGVAFYLRFLVALCMECKPCWGGYWVRLRLNSREHTLVEMPDRTRAVTRAA